LGANPPSPSQEKRKRAKTNLPGGTFYTSLTLHPKKKNPAEGSGKTPKGIKPCPMAGKKLGSMATPKRTKNPIKK